MVKKEQRNTWAMANEFSITEIRLIKSLLSKKTDEAIAMILERPVEEVTAKIRELSGMEVSHSDIMRRRKIRQEEQLRLKEEKKRINLLQQQQNIKKASTSKLISLQNAEREQRRKTLASPLFATRAIDYSEMKAVRIDSRTIIYAKPGEDPEVVRKKYLSNKQLPKNIAPVQRSATVEVKKFKPIK
jgi:hypothetical protein